MYRYNVANDSMLWMRGAGEFMRKVIGIGIQGLSIREEEKYQKLQGTYPVIFLSFAAVKADNLSDARLATSISVLCLRRILTWSVPS